MKREYVQKNYKKVNFQEIHYLHLLRVRLNIIKNFIVFPFFKLFTHNILYQKYFWKLVFHRTLKPSSICAIV